MDAGRILAGAYHIPATVAGNVRIGKETDEKPLVIPVEGGIPTELDVLDDDAPLTSIAGTQDTITQESRPIGPKEELTKTQATGDS